MEALTIIGVRIPIHKLKTTKKYQYKRRCDHDYNINFKFCPECGKPNLDDEIIEESDYNSAIKQYDGSSAENDSDLNTSMIDGKYKIYYNNNYGESLDFCYICIYMNKKDGPRSYDSKKVVFNPIKFEQLIEFRDAMKLTLAVRHILNGDEFDKAFGIYTDVHVSY